MNVRNLVAAEPEDDNFGEIEVSEYIVFLFALDTYLRYLEEVAESAVDEVADKGLKLLRLADTLHLDSFEKFVGGHLPKDTQRKMLSKALRTHPTPDGAARRALQIRTVLSRGGAGTMRGIFVTNKALQNVRTAISSSTIDDADSALDKFATISVKNSKIRTWIKLASDTAGSGYTPTPVAGAAGVSDDTRNLIKTRITESGSAMTSEEGAQARHQGDSILQKVQSVATSSAKSSLVAREEEDLPPKKSEVVGIATAAVVAALSDPEDERNIPEALRRLDPEQRMAALTDGRVLVAAGAGSGKSTTLVARIKYLTTERHVNPSRVFACSFNKKAAEELKGKIAKSLGYNVKSTSGVQVGTMHSLFYKFICGDKQTAGYGTPEERAMLKPPRLVAPPKEGLKDSQGGVKTISPIALTTAIRDIWSECGPDTLAGFVKGAPREWFEGDPPKSKKVNLILNAWRGNDVTLEQAKEIGKGSKAEAQAAVWYELYLGVKGDIPGWRPPATSKSYTSFISRHRKGGERLGDLDDMLKVFRDILRRDPRAKKEIQGNIDHILVDEAQDSNAVQHQIFELMSEHVSPDSKDKSIWMIGDEKQCIASDTLVRTKLGLVRASDLKSGDTVLSYRNGVIVSQVVTVKPSSWTWGYRISTESGNTLTMSPNHKIWATAPEIVGDATIVYLMYRKDLGFRVGITNKCEDATNPFGRRTLTEHADKLWVIELATSRKEALYLEEYYSLKYGIPTMVFNGTSRGIDQDRVNRIFSEFGQNGLKLLEGKHLSFELPNWTAYSNTKGSVNRRTIQLVAHGSSSSQVAIEWTGSEFDTPLTNAGISYTTEGDRHRIRRWFNNYRDAVLFANNLCKLLGAGFRERLSTIDGPLPLLTASALLPSMKVAVYADGGVTQEKITSVDIVRDQGFLDLDVDDASNFFGGDILSHNSIYQFRGAKPELFVGLHGKEGWKTRVISTNYRCEPEIVEAANRLASNNEGGIPMRAVANPQKTPGKASIEVETPPDNTTAAISTLDRIRKDMDEEGAQAEDYAVLTRTNAELNDFETACIINEVPYIRTGGKGFLEAPETKALLGYINLATGNDYEKLKKSLIAVLMKPDRNLFLGADDVEKAVDEAIDTVSRRERVDKKFFRPTMLLEPRYIGILADCLKQPYKLQMIGNAATPQKGEYSYKMRVEELTVNLKNLRSDLEDLRNLIENENIGTPQLLNYVLDNMSSEIGQYDKVTRVTTVTKTTLREQVSADLALFSSDEDVEEDEEDDGTLKGQVGEDGQMVHEDKDKGAAGLGAIQFLVALANPNKNDFSRNTDPSTSQGFVKKIERYSELADTLRIDAVAWEKEQAKIADESQRRSKPPAVTLSTVHSVKGAEWKNVTVMMPLGVFPLMRKPKPDEPPPDPEKEAERIKAERNLAYVAITRAAENLNIVCPDNKGVSPFVFEAGLKVGQNVPKGTGTEPTTKFSSDLDESHVEETLVKFAAAKVAVVDFDYLGGM